MKKEKEQNRYLTTDDSLPSCMASIAYDMSKEGMRYSALDPKLYDLLPQASQQLSAPMAAQSMQNVSDYLRWLNIS